MVEVTISVNGDSKRRLTIENMDDYKSAGEVHEYHAAYYADDSVTPMKDFTLLHYYGAGVEKLISSALEYIWRTTDDYSKPFAEDRFVALRKPPKSEGSMTSELQKVFGVILTGYEDIPKTLPVGSVIVAGPASSRCRICGAVIETDRSANHDQNLRDHLLIGHSPNLKDAS